MVHCLCIIINSRPTAAFFPWPHCSHTPTTENNRIKIKTDNPGVSRVYLWYSSTPSNFKVIISRLINISRFSCLYSKGWPHEMAQINVHYFCIRWACPSRTSYQISQIFTPPPLIFNLDKPLVYCLFYQSESFTDSEI